MEMKSQTPLAIFGEFGVYDIIAGATAPMWAGGEHFVPGDFYLDGRCSGTGVSSAFARAWAKHLVGAAAQGSLQCTGGSRGI